MNPDMLFVGIDISKLKHDVAIINEHKQLLHKLFVVADDIDGYQHMLAVFNRVRQRYRSVTFKIGMEATGDYWKNLYYFLKQQLPDDDVTVINPFQTRSHARSELRRASTDPVCAKDIACFMAEKKPRPTVDRAPVFNVIKDMDTQLHAMKKQYVMTINRLRNELAKVAPEIERAFRKVDSQQLLALLARYPTAALIANASGARLAAVKYGRHRWALPGPFIETVKQLCANSVAHKAGPGAGVVVQTLVRQLRTAQKDIQKLNAQMAEMYTHVSQTDSLLTSIYGISKQTAIALEAYIGDVSRFPAAKQIVAYFLCSQAGRVL